MFEPAAPAAAGRVKRGWSLDHGALAERPEIGVNTAVLPAPAARPLADGFSIGYSAMGTLRDPGREDVWHAINI